MNLYVSMLRASVSSPVSLSVSFVSGPVVFEFHLFAALSHVVAPQFQHWPRLPPWPQDLSPPSDCWSASLLTRPKNTVKILCTPIKQKQSTKIKRKRPVIYARLCFCSPEALVWRTLMWSVRSWAVAESLQLSVSRPSCGALRSLVTRPTSDVPPPPSTTVSQTHSVENVHVKYDLYL